MKKKLELSLVLKSLLFYCFFFIICCYSVFSQSSVQQDYSKIDSYVDGLAGKKFKSVKLLATTLCKPCTNDYEKTRSFFDWIALNISYQDHQFSTNASQVLNRGSAVCEGFAALFKALCDSSNIPCQTITGFAKTRTLDITMPSITENHAWNAVQINNTWHLVDVTWGAGYRLLGTTNFIKHTDYFYFMPDPSELILTHFPIDTSWQLTDTTVSSKQFESLPLFYPHIFEDGIHILEPLAGIQKHKLNDSLVIKFTRAEKIDTLVLFYLYKGDRYSSLLQVKSAEDYYYVVVPFTRRMNSELTIFDDAQALITYAVMVN